MLTFAVNIVLNPMSKYAPDRVITSLTVVQFTLFLLSSSDVFKKLQDETTSKILKIKENNYYDKIVEKDVNMVYD